MVTVLPWYQPNEVEDLNDDDDNDDDDDDDDVIVNSKPNDDIISCRNF